MKDDQKTKEQLINELKELRQRIFELERVEAEHRQGEKALKETQKRYRKLFEQSNDAVIIRTLDGTILDVNSQVCKMLGYSRNQLLTMNVQALHPEDDYLSQNKGMEMVKKNGTVRLATQFKKADDKSIDVDISTSIIDYNQGIVQSIIRDITEYKQADEDLKDSEERYRGLFDNSSDFLFTLDLKGNFTDVNKAAEQLTGYTKAELIVMNFKDYTHRNDHRKLFQAFHEVFKTGKPLQDFSIEAIIKDKTKKYFEININLLKKGKVIIGFQGSSKDITEHKKAYDALRESEERLSLTLESAGLGLWDHNIKTNKIIRSKQWAEMLGYELKDINSNIEAMKNLIHPDDLPKVEEIIKDHELGKTKNFKIEHRMKTKTGDWKWILNWGRIIERDNYGKPVRALGTHLDITERKKAEMNLKKSAKEKEILLQEAHHRVKNNFQLVSSLLRLQSRHITYPEDKVIFKESQERILLFSRLHENLYQSELVGEVNMHSYLNKIINGLCVSYNIKSDRISVKTNIEKLYIRSKDATSCGILLNELFTNAIKHGFPTKVDEPEEKKGEIKVSFTRRPDNKYEMIISNNGIPFPEDVDFRKTETLGLHLVMMLVQQLEGIIELDREEGTTFKIVF